MRFAILPPRWLHTVLFQIPHCAPTYLIERLHFTCWLQLFQWTYWYKWYGDLHVMDCFLIGTFWCPSFHWRTLILFSIGAVSFSRSMLDIKASGCDSRQPTHRYWLNLHHDNLMKHKCKQICHYLVSFCQYWLQILTRTWYHCQLTLPYQSATLILNSSKQGRHPIPRH